MKTHIVGFVVGLSQLAAVCAFASDSTPRSSPANAPDGVVPVVAQGPVAREIGKTYVYELPAPTPAPVLAEASLAPSPTLEPDAALLQMPIYQVKDLNRNLYRDVNVALAQQDLNAPCDLIVEDLRSGNQFRAFGPPAPPMPAETNGAQYQVRMPLVSLIW